MQHSQIGPYLHHLRHLPSVQSPPCRSSIRSSLSMPQSILIPDNQLALASQGFYEYTPSIDSFLKEQSKQLPLPAAERRKNYRSTRTQQTWSLIEPEKDTESEMLKLKQNRNTFGASIDSALSSDMENSSEKRHFLTNSRWSFWKQPSKDSESSTSSIRDIRAGHVNKLMSFDETDDDYEVFSPLENHVRTLLSDRNSPLQIPEPRICDNFKRTSLERDLQTLISSTESTFDFSNDPNRYSLDNISDLTKYSKSTEHSQLQLSAAPMEVLSDNGLIPISAKEANFSDYPANMKEVRRLKIGAEKNPFIYRIGSAQSDSSGFVESDSLVEPPMSYLDALSVNDVGDRGGYDSSETISSGIYKRLSINSDTTIKDLAASSSSSSSQCPCDKSVGTDQIFKSDRSVSTEPFIKQTMASQTDSCCFCTWCINSNQVCAHLHSTVPYQSTVSTACGMSLHIDASNNFSPITDWTLETSPCLTRRRETSNLNLFISDGRILFCDNDSNNNQNWDSDDVESSRRLGCSFMELESTETNDLKSRTFSRHQNCLNRVSESDSPFCLLNSRSVSRIDDTSKNVIEYRKLLKLTNRKTFIQSFLNNPFLPYTPHVRIEIWAEKPINMHLQEENQLMQHAVQRYKFDLQIIESTFLSCFNHITDLLSEEETLMMDELYELWTAVNIEVGHLEKLLVERQRFVRNGNSELTTLTSLQVIPLMTKVLKEQLCAFHLNSDIFEMTMEPRNSNPIPFYPQPGWNSLSVEMQNLRSQISGQNNIQAVHLNRSMEELKESMLLEIQRNITQNFNRLFMG